MQTQTATLLPEYHQGLKRIEMFCFDFQFIIMAGMAFSKVYSEVESTEDHWVSGSMSEEDTAPWVVMLPQSNQIKSKQSKLNGVFLCQ